MISVVTFMSLMSRDNFCFTLQIMTSYHAPARPTHSSYLSTSACNCRLEFTKAMVEEWCKSLGVVELRASSDHSFLGDISGEPTDETVAALFEPISMLLAQFGTQVPNGSKIKVLCQHLATSR